MWTDTDATIVVTRGNGLQETDTKTNMHIMTIILAGKTVAIVFQVDQWMGMEVDILHTIVVEILSMITIRIDDLQIDTRTLAILSIVVVVNLFQIAGEMGLILVLTLEVPHHLETIETEAIGMETIGMEVGHIHRMGEVVLLPGNIRIEIHMGHRDVVHLHNVTIDVSIEKDRIGQKEMTEDIRFEIPRAEETEPDLRDEISFSSGVIPTTYDTRVAIVLM